MTTSPPTHTRRNDILRLWHTAFTVFALLVAAAPALAQKGKIPATEANIELALSQGNRSKFMDFADKKVAILESVQFLQDATVYAKADKKQREIQAKDMYKKYIKDGAKREVNVSSELKEKIKKGVGDFSADLFAAARTEIMGLVVNNLSRDNKSKWEAFAPDLTDPALKANK